MWRNVVSPKCACIAHAVLQEPEYLSGPTSHLADSVRHEMMSLKHWHDVTYFPGVFFNVPVRVSLQVLARGIFLFKHQVYLPTSNASPHTQEWRFISTPLMSYHSQYPFQHTSPHCPFSLPDTNLS